MTSQEDYSILERFQLRFSEAIFHGEALPSVLSDLAEFFDASVCQLMVADGDHRLLQSRFSRDFSDDLLQLEYEFQDINPRVRAIPRMSRMKASRDQDFITKDEIKLDTVYQEMIHPLGMGHFSGVPIVMSDSLVAGVAMYRHQDDDAFDAAAVVRQEAVARFLEPVMNFVAELEQSRVTSVLALLGLDHPVIIVDRRGRVVSRNDASEQLMMTGAARINPDRCLRFDYAADGKALSLALSRGLGVSHGRFLVHTPDGTPQAIASIYPIEMFNVVGALAGSVAITFKLLRPTSIFDGPLARAAYGLTRAEADVTALFMDGLTVAAISKRRSTTENTTRTMLKRVMAKVGVSRQTELFSELSVFVVPGPVRK